MDQAKPPTIRIMRPGTFTSVEGRAVTFGEAEMRAIAAAYDVKSDPAPLVIGHPQVEDQAYGWVGGLRVENGELVADMASIDPQFAERGRRGDYRRVSASFYEPGNPNNPKPGQRYLKHIGVLGAHAPGVKGLGTVQFAEEPADQLTTIDFAEKDTIMADKTSTDTSSQTAAADADAARKQREALEERERQVAERERAAKEREEAQAKREAQARHEGNVSYAESLVKNAKLAPASKAMLIGVFDAVGELETEATISFGEGEAKLSPLAALKKLFDAAPAVISFGEQAGRERTPGTGTTSFAAPPGYVVNPEQDALHGEAMRIQSANPNKKWMDCVREAQAA